MERQQTASKAAQRIRALLRVTRHTSLVILVAVPTLAYAADQKLFAAPQSSTSAPVSSAGGLAQVTLSLVLVLAAVFAAAWVARRMRTIGRPHGGALRVLAEVAVGTKERVVLVQVHEQQVLVGVATGNVNVLHVLPAGTPVPSKEVAPPSDQGGQTRPDFKALLKRSLGLR